MRLFEFTQDMAEASGYDGSEPLDLSKNPSVNDVFKRALYIYDYEGYGNNMDYSEDEAIDQYVAQKFGQDVLNQLTYARNQQYFGRADGKGPGGGGRTSNLGTSSAPGGNFRTTKAGVMNKQDAKTMKGRIANRLGRHPEPNLPEGMMDNPGQEDSPVAQAIIRRILLQRTDLLAKHGPVKVGQAVDEVADFVGDVDEIGSSDVSGWVRHVEQMLGNMQEGVAEVSDATLTSYLTKLDKDNLKHRMDPTKRSDSKRMKSGPNFVKAFTKLDNRKQGVGEGSDNPYGYSKGQTVKLDNGQQGRVIDIFDDSIEVLLVGGRTVTVDFRDAQVIGEQSVAEGAVKELSSDLKDMSDEEFQSRYKMTKAQARANLKKKNESLSEVRDRRDAYQRDYDSSVAGMGKRQSYAYSQDGGANDEGDDSIDAKIRADYEKKKQYEVSGKFWLKKKDTQEHISDEFVGKAAATKAALELLKQQPELKGNLLITAYGPNEKQESVNESDLNRIRKLSGIL